MKRIEFLKTSVALVLGGMATPLMSSCSEAKKENDMRKNWAGNYQYQAPDYFEPADVEEVRSLVIETKQNKALGSCHCFNNIADSPSTQISTKKLNKFLSLDEANQTVTVESGVRYGDFAKELTDKGYALHNLASLPHISVAGACATATHGSGVSNGNLATSVVGLEIVNGNGEVLQLSKEKDGEMFNGVVVGLGALGIITKVTLAVQKAFEVRQDLFQDLPLSSLQENFDAIMSGGYSVSLFTDWQNQLISQVWVKSKVEDFQELGDTYYGAKAATKNLHPITALSAENCTEQLGVSGPWYERLPHFKMGFTPSSGEELQSEFFVPRKNAVEAYMLIEQMKDEIFPELLISEIRTIAADEFWMSPCYRQDSVAFHFTWKQHTPEVMALLPKIEAALAPFNVKPHWGKLFTISPKTLRARYEKYDDFMGLVKSFDPKGKFRNDYLNKNIYPNTSDGNKLGYQWIKGIPSDNC